MTFHFRIPARHRVGKNVFKKLLNKEGGKLCQKQFNVPIIQADTVTFQDALNQGITKTRIASRRKVRRIGSPARTIKVPAMSKRSKSGCDNLALPSSGDCAEYRIVPDSFSTLTFAVRITTLTA